LRYVILFFALWIFWLPLLASGPYFVPLCRDNKKIDVVYTWVNEADSSWQEKYKAANQSYSLPRALDANFHSRFRNRDELKYSMRSIAMFADFVNHIYIVTDGQKPKWLQEHPMITVVSHSTIFKNTQHLPTFNSMAIEANLHHIPGLQERFIYFHDDMFVGRFLKKRDFYSKHGKSKVFISNKRAPQGRIYASDTGFRAGWKRTNEFFKALGFSKKKRKSLEHAPVALRKSQLEQFERLFPQIVDTNSSHKFRSTQGYCLLNGLIQNFSLHHKQAKKDSLRTLVVKITADFEGNYKRLNKILRKRPHLFCLQDVDNLDNMEVDGLLRDFLEMLYYEKAPWEV
jgi:hypothetical protein